MSAQGRCNCGKFAFEVPPLQGIAICHCKPCTRAGGSIGSFNAVIPADGITFTKGSLKELGNYQDTETSSGNPMARHFCGSCGSAIISIPKGSPIGFFKVSSLDDAQAYIGKDRKPDQVIFQNSAPDFVKKLDWGEGVKTASEA
ncbi:hypothetical protein IE81DRAFT_346068 [Ceraceosorus guamensis]|uniref:CENP-V/GFA domain-containing protein n=1 Tax=Ceraceosorus guamensis TaxID=1522189 RepID=A0A316W2I7_9BASI|nr:hypothetical protein IE81DRAFT_346068 [Ceraceosorus guamensis]PWN43899.1 hypothetical protein IE81DRAFT_346068 [Ceraceosorus guamensis]